MVKIVRNCQKGYVNGIYPSVNLPFDTTLVQAIIVLRLENNTTYSNIKVKNE